MRIEDVTGQVTDQLKLGVRWGVGQKLPRTAVRAGARRGDLQARMIEESGGRSHTFELLDLFDQVRAHGPLMQTRLSYLTADHATVREVLTGADFRSGFVPARGPLARLLHWADSGMLDPISPPSLLATEPPEHTRYRKLVSRVFTARAVEKLRERTEKLATELLGQLDTGRPVDLVQSYCVQLPVTVIAEILGVPESDRAKLHELGTGAAASLDLGLSWREYREVQRSLAEFDGWLSRHLQRLRDQPGEDLLSQVVAAREDGVGLSETELKSLAGLVLAAGFETTVNLLGNGIALLEQHPDQLAVLRERPELWGNAVDEILRVDPPVLLTGRTVAADTELAGLSLRRGALVSALLAAANYDPAVFADPRRFDVTRENARDHLSFSAGRHYCLGAALARMEGEVGLRALFDRFSAVRLLPGATRRPTRILRGYDRLPAVVA